MKRAAPGVPPASPSFPALAGAALLAAAALLARSALSASVPVDFTHCANDAGSSTSAKGDGVVDPCSWTTGALNKQNSTFAETDAVPTRLFVPVGPGDHAIVFTYDFTRSGKYAFDFVAELGHSTPLSLWNACEELPKNPSVSQEMCDSLWANGQAVPVPTDPFDSVALREHPASRRLVLSCFDTATKRWVACGQPAVTAITHDPGTPCSPETVPCGTSSASVRLSFSTTAASTMTALWFATHLASGVDPVVPTHGWGAGLGAASITGAQVGVFLTSIDGQNVGANTLPFDAGMLASGHVSDLSIAKSGPASVVQGNDVTYDLVATNAGPGTATGVVVADALPLGVTFVSAVANDPGVRCGLLGSEVFCDVGFLDVKQSVVVTVTVRTSAAAPVGSCSSGGGLTDVARVTGTVNDPNLSNNSSSICTDVVAPTPAADLGVTKSGPASVVAGSQATYVVTVHNWGPSTALDPVLVETVPFGTSLVSFAPFPGNSTPWSCSGTRVVVCRGPANTFVNGAEASFTVVLAVRPTTRGSFTNRVVVASGSLQLRPDLHPNFGSVTTTVTTSVDVGIVKTASVLAVVGGNELVYTIVATNPGPSAATTVDVVDVLPAVPAPGSAFASATASQGECGWDAPSRTVTCSLGTLAPGATVTVTIVVETPLVPAQSACPAAGLSNTATATGYPEADTDPANNTSTVCTTLDPLPSLRADLSISKSAPTTAVAGTTIPYGITISNAPGAGAAATGVLFADPLPTGTTFSAWGAGSPPAGWTCRAPAAGSPGTVSCVASIGTTIAPGASQSFSFVVKIEPGTSGPGIVNTAVAAAGNDLNRHPADASTSVTQFAALTISKTNSPPSFGPGTVTEGDPVIFGIAVTNPGPSDAFDVVVTDVLDPAFTFNASGSGSTCGAVGQVVTCTIAYLAAGQGVTGAIAVTASAGLLPGSPAPVVVPNTAAMAWGDGGPASANTVDTVINPAPLAPADLAVSKSAPATVVAGSAMSYTITASNTGATTATGIVVIDDLPSGVTFRSAAPPRCSAVGQVVGCVVGSLAPGTSTVLSLAVDVSSSLAAGTVLSNTATVVVSPEQGGPSDTTPGDNSSTASTTVTALADLGITKDGPASALPGGRVTYVVTVENYGPSAASTPVLTDAVPPGTTLAGVSAPAGWSCGGSPITCTGPASFPVGSVASFAIVLDVSPTATGSITNTATVSSSTPEPSPDPHPNTATATSPVPSVPVEVPALSGGALLGLALLLAGAGLSLHRGR